MPGTNVFSRVFRPHPSASIKRMASSRLGILGAYAKIVAKRLAASSPRPNLLKSSGTPESLSVCGVKYTTALMPEHCWNICRPMHTSTRRLMGGSRSAAHPAASPPFDDSSGRPPRPPLPTCAAAAALSAWTPATRAANSASTAKGKAGGSSSSAFLTPLFVSPVGAAPPAPAPPPAALGLLTVFTPRRRARAARALARLAGPGLRRSHRGDSGRKNVTHAACSKAGKREKPIMSRHAFFVVSVTARDTA
mmetsp:Transcript_48588/g.97759  ORF Transcript_48588/g.97759 Transcript_48588/m.97759 type:complete len:250 (-) Transcript_48588:696-1445(-)